MLLLPCILLSVCTYTYVRLACFTAYYCLRWIDGTNCPQVNSATHRALAVRAAREGVVLLRNAAVVPASSSVSARAADIDGGRSAGTGTDTDASASASSTGNTDNGTYTEPALPLPVSRLRRRAGQVAVIGPNAMAVAHGNYAGAIAIQ
jgi:hypothetical protein